MLIPSETEYEEPLKPPIRTQTRYSWLFLEQTTQIVTTCQAVSETFVHLDWDELGKNST